ncbi:hypothetical protein ABT040_41455 [Streptomyces sp. NPDC002688]|uniref:hypothetical protein n=1 Tax=Streptomyces sp. NPDC002688 TaxID=3154423 RepID=UPI0033190A5E
MPPQLKQMDGWDEASGDVERITNQPFSFVNADALGIFIEGGVHVFLNNAASVAFNEPILRSLDSPQVTEFY